MRLLFLFGVSVVILMNILCKENIEDVKENAKKLGIVFRRQKRNASDIEFNKSDVVEVNLTKQMRLIEIFKKRWPVMKWKYYGYYSDEFLEMINEHWLGFPPPDATVQRIMASFYIVFGTLGCWGNAVVLFMYFNVVCLENIKLWKRRKRLNRMFDELKVSLKRKPMEYVFDLMSTSVNIESKPQNESDLIARFKERWPIHLWRRFLFMDEFLVCINEHWLGFPPPDPEYYYILGGLYVVMAVIGCSGNAVSHLKTNLMKTCSKEILNPPSSISSSRTY
ncbi:unnamed protein product [Leptidea sinapis]|uniref:Uncharacterized protein n=1 Tax=Leptidea sinapis TaxID=189913 RepID=A0A5E4QXW2_9NEOP|nr:unnamed protein product [Leptidea sinapis]